MKKLYAVAAMAVLLCLAGFIMPGATFAQQCEDSGDGTVTDNSTGLMWQKATAGPMDWDAAMSYASGLSLGGHSGWRLPSRSELLGLYHSSCKSMMDIVKTDYWSSTIYVRYTGNAWVVNFDNGLFKTPYQSSSHLVRWVRSSQ